jgi:hypothetical protein
MKKQFSTRSVWVLGSSGRPSLYGDYGCARSLSVTGRGGGAGARGSMRRLAGGILDHEIT